jgi:hypothetical protein
MKKNMGSIAGLLYLLGAILIPHSFIFIFFNIDALVLYLFAFFMFLLPAFFICLFVFATLDWGLKKLLLERSLLGLLPMTQICLLLSAPVIAASYYQTELSFDNWIVVYTALGVGLLWSIFVVGLQLWLRPTQKSGKKRKNGS